MAEILMGFKTDFDTQDVRVMVVEGREIGIFRLEDEFYAYENVCPHAGGPVCQGRLMPRVEEKLSDDKTSQGQCFSRTNIHIVCPWHGYEYDIRTGQHQAHDRLKLTRFDLRLDGDRILVTL